MFIVRIVYTNVSLIIDNLGNIAMSVRNYFCRTNSLLFICFIRLLLLLLLLLVVVAVRTI